MFIRGNITCKVIILSEITIKLKRVDLDHEWLYTCHKSKNSVIKNSLRYMQCKSCKETACQKRDIANFNIQLYVCIPIKIHLRA
jgi:hypothetical protein